MVEKARGNDPSNELAKVAAFDVAMKIKSYSDALRIAGDLVKMRPMQAGFWKEIEKELFQILSIVSNTAEVAN